MILVSDRMVAAYFDAMAQSYKDFPDMKASDRMRLVLAAVLREADYGERNGGRSQNTR